MTTASDLLHKYTDPVTGALDVARALGEGAATQVGSGLAGIGSAVRHLSMDAGADAVDKFQRDHQPGELGAAGIKTIQNIAPSFYKAAHSGVAQDAQALMDKYSSGVDRVAGGVGKFLPQVGAGISAAGAALPNAAFPEASEESVAEHTLEPIIAKYGTDAINDAKGADSIAHTISLEPAGDAHQPSALSMVARHPETGAELGRLTMQPRGNVMQGIRSDVAPEAQGQGIGTKLLQRAIDRSHERGMDFQSDTSVTPSQMATYLKLREKGYPVEVNLNSEHWDSPDGPALRSTDGQGVVSVNRQVDAEHATPQDLPQAMVVPHTNGYGNMVNGKILSTHPDLASAQDAADAVNAGNFKEGGEVEANAGGAVAMLQKSMRMEAGLPAKKSLSGFADGGAVEDDVDMNQAHQLAQHLDKHGSFLYNPHTGDVEPMDATSSVPIHVTEIDAKPSAADIHHLIMTSRPLMDENAKVFAASQDGRHLIGVTRHQPG